MSILGLKQQYNNTLMRFYKACVYMDEYAVPIDKLGVVTVPDDLIAQKLKWLPQFQDILNELNYTLSLLEADGIKATFDEQMGGFNI